MKVYEGKHIRENQYLINGELSEFQVDKVVAVEIETGETVDGVVVTRTSGAAVVEV